MQFKYLLFIFLLSFSFNKTHAIISVAKVALKTVKVNKSNKRIQKVRKAPDGRTVDKHRNYGKSAKGAHVTKSAGSAKNASGNLAEGANVTKGGTYKLRDADGVVQRTGKSNDLNRRRREHARHQDTKDLDFEVDRRTDNPLAQRGREQIIYVQNPQAQAKNGGLNKRRPISPTNKKRDKYMKAGEKL